MRNSEHDTLCPVHEQFSCYEVLGQSKQLVCIPKAQHYESYAFCSPEKHEVQKRAAINWFRQYL